MVKSMIPESMPANLLAEFVMDTNEIHQSQRGYMPGPDSGMARRYSFYLPDEEATALWRELTVKLQ